MSESDLERMFEPFYRGHDRSNEGYGLGLAIVRRLCSRFGWELHADSELGAGTEIRVEFPEATSSRLQKSKRRCKEQGARRKEQDTRSFDPCSLFLDP
jgi:signal transduction histidine kinase